MVKKMKSFIIKKIKDAASYANSNKCDVIIWIIAIFIMCFGLTIYRYFRVTQIEQAIFHVSANLQGVDKRLVSGFLRHAVLEPILYIIISMVMFSSLPKLAKRIRILSIVLLMLACIRLFSCFSHYSYLTSYFTADFSSDFYKEHIVQPEVSSVSFSEKRNLIVIYMESLEASFSDESIFPINLLPELSAWRNKHTSIKEAFQAHNTGWTIAGIVSSWSGLPLRAGAGVKNEAFMPNIVMVTDILAQNGYSLQFVQGTLLSFSGKKYLFASHGFKPWQCIGLETIREKHPDWETIYHGPPSFVGVRDSVTYQLAKDSLLNLSRGDKPFAFFMLTYNPHFSEGFVEPHWQGPRIEGFSSKEQAYADVVTNADSLAAEFLQWISIQDFAKNTAVIVLSDHFAMTPMGLDSMLEKNEEKRRNLNIVINPVRPLNTEGRAICHFDWAPTMLEAVGAKLPEGKMGLGVSLFSGKKTLVEEYGIQKLNEELTKYSQYYVDLVIEGKK